MWKENCSFFLSTAIFSCLKYCIVQHSAVFLQCFSSIFCLSTHQPPRHSHSCITTAVVTLTGLNVLYINSLMLLKWYIKRPNNQMSTFNKETKTINHDTLLYCCIQNNLFPVENPVQSHSWQFHKYYNSHVKTRTKKWTPVTPKIQSSKSDLHDKCNKLLHTSQLLHAVYTVAYDWTINSSSTLYYVNVQHFISWNKFKTWLKDICYLFLTPEL